VDVPLTSKNFCCKVVSKTHPNFPKTKENQLKIRKSKPTLKTEGKIDIMARFSHPTSALSIIGKSQAK
jgi:hypothetical protein